MVLRVHHITLLLGLDFDGNSFVKTFPLHLSSSPKEHFLIGGRNSPDFTCRWFQDQDEIF